MAVLFSPWGNQQFFDESGNAATGWKIYTYAAGSSSALATYTDSTGGVAQSNPIIINALGFVTSGQVWLTSGLSYKLVLTDANDVVKKTEDNITGVTGASTTSQWQASGLAPTYVSATSFTLAGDQTTAFHVGRRLQSTNTSGTIYSTIVSSAYGALTTVTVVNDSGVLDSGLSQVNYGLLTATSPSLPAIGAYGQCQLVKSGANLQLNPKTGNLLTINGVAQKIPATPPTLAPTSLSATTLYYIYAYMSGAVMTLEASTTGHSVDATTNMEIKTGDATRTLVGMAYVKTAATFADSTSQRFTRSWFNDSGVTTGVVLSANTNQANTSYAEPSSSIRNEVAIWSGEAVVCNLSGTVSSNGLGNTVTTAVGIDATNNGEFGASRCYQPAATVGTPMACSVVRFSLSEGFHFITMVGLTDAGTATWSGSPNAHGCFLSVQTRR